MGELWMLIFLLSLYNFLMGAIIKIMLTFY